MTRRPDLASSMPSALALQPRPRNQVVTAHHWDFVCLGDAAATWNYDGPAGALGRRDLTLVAVVSTAAVVPVVADVAD